MNLDYFYFNEVYIFKMVFSCGAICSTVLKSFTHEVDLFKIRIYLTVFI